MRALAQPGQRRRRDSVTGLAQGIGYAPPDPTAQPRAVYQHEIPQVISRPARAARYARPQPRGGLRPYRSMRPRDAPGNWRRSTWRRQAGERRARGEEALGGGDAGAEVEGDAAVAEGQLRAAEGGEDLQLVESAEVADAHDAALQLAQAGAEGQVEALAGALQHRVAVDALGQDDRGDRVRGPLRALAEDAEAPGPDGGAHGGSQAGVASVDRRQALLGEHRQRLAQPEQEQGSGRVGEEAGGVVAQVGPPVEVVARRAAAPL